MPHPQHTPLTPAQLTAATLGAPVDTVVRQAASRLVAVARNGSCGWCCRGTQRAPWTRDRWRIVLGYVAQQESGSCYHRIDATHDDGVRFGLLGWNAVSGQLQRLLYYWQRRSPEQWLRVWGDAWALAPARHSNAWMLVEEDRPVTLDRLRRLDVAERLLVGAGMTTHAQWELAGEAHQRALRQAERVHLVTERSQAVVLSLGVTLGWGQAAGIVSRIAGNQESERLQSLVDVALAAHPAMARRLEPIAMTKSKDSLKGNS